MTRNRPEIQLFAAIAVILALLVTGCGDAGLGGEAAQSPAPADGTQTGVATTTPLVSQRTIAATATTTSSAVAPTRQSISASTKPSQVTAQQPSEMSLVTAVRRVADARKPGVVLIANRPERVSGAFNPNPGQGGIGSGVIIDPAGHIITNNHVVAGAGSLEVVLPDGRRFDGTVVGRDPRTDLAVIKIEGDNLPVVPLAPNVNVGVGDWVVAIGNALGLPGGPTVTTGVVGALNRNIEEPNSVTLTDLIQTDAAINPGNSGGPLLNLSGEVVGINTAGIQGAEGLGFAVSVDTVHDIVPQLIQHGMVTRPFIGIGTQQITPGIAARFGLPTEQGLLIVQVAPNSPAARARLQQGDILLAINGREITSEAELQNILRNLQPGDTVTLTIQRGGDQRQIRLTLGTAPAPQ